MRAIITPNKERLRRSTPFIAIGLFLAIAPPFLGVTIASLMTKILIFALLAMSLDLVFGYTGLWSFGHAALFGVGAYTNGILIKHYDITSFWLAAPTGVFMAGLSAAIFCIIAQRGRGLYFLLITFALGQLIYAVAAKWYRFTGGTDGLSGIPYPDLGFAFSFSPISFYYLTLVITALSAYVLYRIINSPFGVSLQGIRESETRMQCLGYNTWLYKLIAFAISGLFAGAAGVLYIHYNGIVAPENVGFTASGSVILMTIIGGSGTLWGAAIGSAVFISLQYGISIYTPERWPLILGVCFIGVVMFLRGGILPNLRRIGQKVSSP